MKKILAIAMASLMLTAPLAACKPDDDDDTESSSTVTTTESVTEDASDIDSEDDSRVTDESREEPDARDIDTYLSLIKDQSGPEHTGLLADTYLNLKFEAKKLTHRYDDGEEDKSSRSEEAGADELVRRNISIEHVANGTVEVAEDGTAYLKSQAMMTALGGKEESESEIYRKPTGEDETYDWLLIKKVKDTGTDDDVSAWAVDKSHDVDDELEELWFDLADMNFDKEILAGRSEFSDAPDTGKSDSVSTVVKSAIKFSEVMGDEDVDGDKDVELYFIFNDNDKLEEMIFDMSHVLQEIMDVPEDDEDVAFGELKFIVTLYNLQRDTGVSTLDFSDVDFDVEGEPDDNDDDFEGP